MKSFLLFVLVVSIQACSLSEIERGRHPDSDGIWSGVSVADPSNACYVTALDYRKGYDWRSDTEKGSVKCSLTVFADCMPVLKVPVGDRYEVSSDPMRHRIINGHLYTDYTDSVTTVVKLDGKVLYRYEGAEEVDDMIVRSGQVHAISSPMEGDGFTYRINGHAVLERSSGKFMGNLCIWKDTVCFCFMQPVTSSAGVTDAYYLAKGGKVEKIILDEDISRVWDMTAHEGKVCMAVSYNNGIGPVMLSDDGYEAVGYIQTLNVISCRFVVSEVLCLNVRSRHSVSGTQSDVLWTEGRSWKSYGYDETLACSYVDTSGFYAAINPTSHMKGLIFKGSQSYVMPEGYCMRGRSPMAVRDGLLYAGLSSRETSWPVVWTEGRLDTLKVNGPVIGLAFPQ